MKHATLPKVLLLSAILALPAATGYSQCSGFVKKKCLPNILPFTSNGQMNTSTLSAGESATMNLTFYAGQSYRILVCAQGLLGHVTFRVMDLTHKVVFDSEENSEADFWDFKVKNTQQFIVEVSAPASQTTTSITPSGCVSVLVGFKKD